MIIERAPTDDATLDELDRVACAAFDSTTFRHQLDWYAATEPHGIFRCIADGRTVGLACAVTYQAAGFGWIGIVGTLPGFARRGIGRATTEACVEFIEAAGCASVLDASTSGAPVYERLGFVDHGPTTFYRPSDGGITPYRGDVGVARVEPADVVDCVELDRSAFGTDREPLITAVIEQAPAGAVIARRGGRPVGFAATQPTLIGPVVARDPEVLHALLASLAALGRERLCLMVPPEYLHREALEAIGFAPDRSLRHMRRGIDTLAADATAYAGRVTLGFG